MAKSLPWYKREPEKALAGMKNLTPEERGIYNTILDLIYFHGDDLEDDDRHVCGWCNCDLRVYRRIKARLISLGKISIDNGRLRNAKASVVVDEYLAMGIANGYAARARWHKSDGETNKNKDLQDAPAMQPHMRILEGKKEEEEYEGPDPRKSIFGLNLAWLKDASGKPDQTCRRFLGRLIAQHGDDATLNALRAGRARAKPPVDPFAWITSIINKGMSHDADNGTRTGTATVRQNGTSPEIAGIAAALAGRSVRPRRKRGELADAEEPAGKGGPSDGNSGTG